MQSNKHLKSMLSLLICVMLMATTIQVLGAGINDNIVDADTRMVNIVVTLPQTTAGQIVSVRVVRDGKNIADVDYSDMLSVKDILNYADESTTNADGVCTFTYKMTDVTGVYTVVAKDNSSGVEYVKTFLSADPDDLITAKNAVNSATNKDEMKTAILSNLIVLNLSFDLYQGIDLALREPIYQTILNIRNQFTSKTFESIGDIQQTFKLATIIRTINLQQNPAEICNIFETYYNIISLDSYSAYNTYLTKFTNNMKLSVGEKMINRGFSTSLEIAEAFAEAVICTQIENATKWTDVIDTLKNNNSYLMIDFTTYNSLENQSSVCKALTGKSYVSADELKTEFIKEVNKQLAIENESKSSNSSGGGGDGIVVRDITVSPVINPQTLTFTDIENFEWAKESIISLANKNIVSGRGDGKFDPEEKVNKEEFLKMLLSGFGLVDDEATSIFTDVSKNDWFYKYIASAEKHSISLGKGDGSFGIGESLTRQEMATLAYRTAQISGVVFENSNEISFADSSLIDSYAVLGISKMKSSGIINGVGNDMFAPLDNCTRAEAATIIYKLLKYANKI